MEGYFVHCSSCLHYSYGCHSLRKEIRGNNSTRPLTPSSSTGNLRERVRSVVSRSSSRSRSRTNQVETPALEFAPAMPCESLLSKSTVRLQCGGGRRRGIHMCANTQDLLSHHHTYAILCYLRRRMGGFLYVMTTHPRPYPTTGVSQVLA
jgi:hypothetical protein